MTPQEVFTKAYLGLKAQGFVRSMSGADDRCSYRGRDGLRCAIGHCIPDELYSKRMDKPGAVDAEELVHRYPKVAALFEDVTPAWLLALQRCHDGSELPSLMKQALESFALHHNLEVPTCP